MAGSSDSLERRRRVYEAASAQLAGLTDEALAARVATAASPRRGVGGDSGVVDLDGRQVFVKRINLTDLEAASGNIGSTANLFELPLFYQYGVGSAGFGAWRELAAYRRASDWVLAGDCPSFPMLYHWRVLPRAAPPPPTEDQQARLQRAVAYWEDSTAIRARLEAIRDAPQSVVLFLEYVPQTAAAWLDARLAAGGEEAAAALMLFHDRLTEVAAFINARGMLHFDLHRLNVLTDGDRLYAGDFGLSLCSDFDLSPAERAFYEVHADYDRGFVALGVVTAAGEQVAPSPSVAATIERCKPAAEVMRRFFTQLREGGKTTPYPAAELSAALARPRGAADL